MASKNNVLWLMGAALGVVGVPMNVAAQTQDQQADAITTSAEIVVVGKITYRDRTDAIAPTLEYGLDYFQRFEPLTAGDALKRVPSVSFLSDITESDGVRLRGLDPAYTQILINGEQVPGSGSGSGTDGNGADTAFFVDRIPAELIERVEVVRSASANRSGDAVAGAINIVLRDSYSLDGGFIRAGVLYFANDDHWGETLGGVWGGEALGGRLLLGANMQDRHNPKDKYSARYSAPGGTLVDIEDQTDVRDGTDYSANFSYEVDVLFGELKLDGFYVRTERFENEDSIEYLAGNRTNASLFSLNDNNVDIDQTSYAFNGRYKFDMLGGETSLKASYAKFDNYESEFENEARYLSRDTIAYPEVDRYTTEAVSIDLGDTETKYKVEHKRDFVAGTELEFGLHYEKKERDTVIATRAETRIDRLNGNMPLPNGAGFPVVQNPFVAESEKIERTRFDPYVMVTGDVGAISYEAGLRYETTDVDVGTVSKLYEQLLPSVSVRWDVSERDRFVASAARTVRNPSFSYISPFLLEAEIGDNDFRGNPQLDQETAIGFDVGYERRLGKIGIAGLNFFYRDIQDLIEVASTGVEGSEGPGSLVLEPRNTGDGSVYGVEFDLSTPLSFIGLEDTGVFLNYSWLDSEVDDGVVAAPVLLANTGDGSLNGAFGTRRFNDQAEFVLNVGFIHDLPSLGAAFGATYRKQGDAESRILGEEVATSYGPDLEVFIEKRFGERFVVRLTGSNLLDESKDEIFDKFGSPEDQRDRTYDEYELESETSGPIFQLIGRYAF